MALVECPECGTEVSSMAGNCPSCGYPMTSRVNRPGWDDDGQVVTIQLTRKRYKLLSVAGKALTLLGFFAVMGGAGAGMFVAGLLISLMARVLIWWHHD